jgi:hypothetical protein
VVVKRNISGISAFLAMLLFPTAYWICEFFYPSMDDIAKWRLLRDCLHGVLILLLVISCIFIKNKLTIASLMGLGVLVISDIVDRLFFGTFTFDWTDWPSIGAAITVFLLKIRTKYVST